MHNPHYLQKSILLCTCGCLLSGMLVKEVSSSRLNNKSLLASLCHHPDHRTRFCSSLRSTARVGHCRYFGRKSSSIGPQSTKLMGEAAIKGSSAILETVIDRIIDASPSAVALCITGGGTQASAWLTTVPGASSKILEVVIPYSMESFDDYLGTKPTTGYCSVESAFLLAERAYSRAAALGPLGIPVYGVSATCTLVTNREKAGEHKVFVGVHGPKGSCVHKLILKKGLRSRVSEDEVASRMVVGALGEASLGDDEVADQLLEGVLVDDEKVEVESKPTTDPITDLLDGRIECVEFHGEHVIVNAPRHQKAVLPGSFNPLHEGHRNMLKVAERILGKPGIFELTISNPDKGLLSREEVLRRLKQFQETGLPLILSMKSRFVDKAAIFQNCTFVVGYDTAVRLVNPKYYSNSHDLMYAEFQNLRAQGCRFLVMGRVDGLEFKGLDSIGVPGPLDDLFLPVPESEFRLDISSTQLRKQAGLE